MAYQKLQASKALAVIKSDTFNIPSGSLSSEGTVTTATASKITDTNNTFTENLIGCIVYDEVGGAVSSVSGLEDENTLLLSTPIIISAGYKIFDKRRSDNVLYVGGAGDLKVTTSSGDIVTLAGVQGGTFLPISVLKVWSSGTTATNIIALW